MIRIGENPGTFLDWCLGLNGTQAKDTLVELCNLDSWVALYMTYLSSGEEVYDVLMVI